MATTTFTGPVVSNNGFTSTAIAFANLPTASASTGQVIFCNDALKASETTGNGTGNLVFSDGSNWVRVDTGATATA
jgi:hypothetical protein